jgi:hypothetical protein
MRALIGWVEGVGRACRAVPWTREGDRCGWLRAKSGGRMSRKTQDMAGQEEVGMKQRKTEGESVRI